MDQGLVLTREMALVLGLVGFSVLMLALDWLRADVVALLVLVVLGVARLVRVEQLFAGFAGDAVIAIMATMILGAGLDRTGVLGYAASFILRLSNGVERRLLLVLCALTGTLSAVMQNPALTALFVPVASRLSSRTGLGLSRLLLPMACCIMLGGTLTMVGNSPQILLNDLIASVNRNLPPGADTLEPFHMFSVTPIGVALLVAGLLFYWLFWDRFVPDREDREIVTPARTETYFASVYGIDGEIIECEVGAGSQLIGLSIGEVEARSGAPLILAIKTDEDGRLAPPADEIIHIGSVLGILGSREQVGAWAAHEGLTMLYGRVNFAEMFNAERAGIAEAVVPPTSSYVGQRVGELRLRKRYGIAVLALNRGEQIIREDLRSASVRAGDSLIFHGFWKNLAQAAEDGDFVVVTDYPKEEERPHKILHAVVFFGLAIGLGLLSDLKLPLSLMAGAIGMLLTGVLSMDEAYSAVSWKTIFMMACLIPLGWAVDSTGAAAWLSQEFLRATGGHPPVLLLQVMVGVLTVIFTQVMSNVGATIVMVPIAINMALAAGANPAAFAMIVALSASNSFVSPSNPVMAIIQGPGSYRNSDLWRAGLPLTVAHLVIVIGMVRLMFR